MPAFDPVRDAVLNSPIATSQAPIPVPSPLPSPSLPLGRRATDLASLLNDDPQQTPLHTPPPARSSTLSHLLHSDDKLTSSAPLRRAQPPSPPPSAPAASPSPSPILAAPRTGTPASPAPTHSPAMPPPPAPSRSSIPYNPRNRVTPPGSVLVPISPAEMEMFKTFRGQGTARLSKRKRDASMEPEVQEQPPAKKLAGDVGVVVNHYNSRPDVGVVQRLDSPIIGLKNFNNWVKSVLITRFAHPVLAKSSISGSGPGKSRSKGKVLDMGCGKGGDMTKWAKARVKELYGVDIAAVSVEQARSRHQSLRGPRFEAHFEPLDCYTEPLSRAFPPARLVQHFDVVSMQFCMHYAFETVQKARCMLENVTRWLRPGGVFIGTIPNADQLLEHLDALPPDTEELSFGNSVYTIRFEDRKSKPVFGHKYWFYLQDAVENVPEYIVRWDNFVQMAADYKLYPVYKEEFHQVFEEHQEHPEFGPLMTHMKVVDANGESSMDEDQWEAANIYIAFAFEKR